MQQGRPTLVRFVVVSSYWGDWLLRMTRYWWQTRWWWWMQHHLLPVWHPPSLEILPWRRGRFWFWAWWRLWWKQQLPQPELPFPSIALAVVHHDRGIGRNLWRWWHLQGWVPHCGALTWFVIPISSYYCCKEMEITNLIFAWLWSEW